jgi:biopolymer transport protein exbB
MNLAFVFQSGDPVLIGVVVIMIAMSIISWVVILMQVIKRISTNKANRAASEAIWSSDSIASAESQAKKNPAPVSELTLAAIDANRSFNAAQNTMLSASLPKNEFLEREIRHSTTQIMGRYDNGMTALASIGATAPFVGLLGTVWGIYHALINIGESGQMSIAVVAGPIGEALVSTAIGLFAAIPAVLAFNAFTRSNKKLSRELHNFGHDLHVQLINQPGKE